MLYESLSKYSQFIVFDEIRDDEGGILYMSATTYTNLSHDVDFNEFLILSNQNGDVLRLHERLSFLITPLKFNRVKIEIFIKNKKIQLFANYFSEVPVNEGVV